MKIFGFDEDLKVFPQDMSFEQFAWSGIHPYRLDLFERNAVTRECDGRMLKFTPLTDLALAFRSSDGSVVVAVHDGQSTWCATGDEAFVSERTLILRKFRLIARPFQDCVREYFAAMYSEDKLPEPFVRPVTAPCVLVKGTEIHFRFGDSLYNMADKAYPRTYFVMHPTYEGVMWEEQRTAFNVPDEIRWLFEELPDHDQMVVGDAVRDALLGRPITTVDVYGKSDLSTSIARRHPEFWENDGKLGGVKYHLRSIRPWPSDPMYRASIFAKHLTSVGAFYFTNANEICGPRIAFHDEGLKQARFLRKYEFTVDITLAERAEAKRKIESEGYVCMDFPTDCPELRKAQSEFKRRNTK